MSEASRCQRGACRLLELAPTVAKAEADALQPLLERLLLCQLQGREPLLLDAAELAELNSTTKAALLQLPLVLIELGSQGAELWSRRQHQGQQSLLEELEQRLHQHHGLLLTGGAGTGKTTRVRQLLANETARKTLLLAPTGKAAARLREALSPLPASMHCATLHRALEANASGGFGRHHDRPLNADVVVVDEVSMVDTNLMRALLEALPTSTRLILVGDSAQLPPIDGSSVLEPLEQQLKTNQPELLLQLERSHRFNDTTALGSFVQQLRQDTSPSALQQQLSELDQESNLRWWPLQRGWPLELQQRLEQHRQNLAQQANDVSLSDEEALACLDDLLVLSPRRSGLQGVTQLNRRWLPLTQREPWHWPAGTPLLVGRNDASLGLANGDRGLVRPSAQGNEAVIASSEGPKRLPLELLPCPEPALALTVHKSQGSQAKEVIVLLPTSSSLDRRLLYTALTRAQQRLDLLSPPLDSLEA